ncbi:MAG: Gfo/Idh/MocA family oxidoreductase, partial [Deltaproteobacteria bacterium]|nr:Gfo/Idh/MocA family oxidoreductase [Deltaproteobacteria bacterium]
AGEVEALIAARDRSGLLVAEAFMVRHHPQWLKVKEVVNSGQLGTVQAMHCFFSYHNVDPDNVRNKANIGGGGLLDIGCYPINLSRFVFHREPVRVSALIEYDTAFKTDRLASALLDFGRSVHVTFTCSTQLSAYQRFVFVGDKARLEVEIPINALSGKAMRLVVDPGQDLVGSGRQVLDLPACDQYTLQGDAFSAAIRGQGGVATTLEDSRANMRVLDAIFRSGKSGRWETP